MSKRKPNPEPDGLSLMIFPDLPYLTRLGSVDERRHRFKAWLDGVALLGRALHTNFRGAEERRLGRATEKHARGVEAAVQAGDAELAALLTFELLRAQLETRARAGEDARYGRLLGGRLRSQALRDAEIVRMMEGLAGEYPKIEARAQLVAERFKPLTPKRVRNIYGESRQRNHSA